MIVTKVSGRRFARWESVDVELPRAGVVLVTGRNGHGKSTIVEAVAQGVWGQSVRGQFGWRVDEKSGVEIGFEGGHVRRSVSKSKHVLKWQVGEHGAAEFPTRTKSQAALASHVGSFHVWRHACTFHTRDASRFTGATDAERKRLLEEVLELDRVEAGYRRARDEMSGAKRGLTEAEHAVSMAASKLDGVARTRAALDGELEEVPDLDAMRAAGRELRATMDAAAEAVEDARAAKANASTEHTASKTKLAAARHRRQHLANLGDVCPTCEQQIVGELHSPEIQTLGDEIERLTADVRAWVEAIDACEQDVRAAVQSHAEARAAYDENVRAGKAAVEAQRRNEARQAKLATIDEEIEQAEAALADAEAQLSTARARLGEIEAAAKVLSYQGVRAAVLTSAVRALEDLANDWLARLGLADLQVRLASQSESKAGKVTDKISFEVEGAGGGLGYVAASTGEQRRIDIAMLLAIGELAADSRGMSAESTLFVDELFDGLDDDGQEAATQMLRELAQTRCVVVISHSAGLVDRLAPTLHLVADSGALGAKG
jgi:DNA repair exonuclease SbcCD ATPase subunit